MNDLADEDFVGVRAVEIGSIEMSDAGVDGVVDEFDHVFFGFGRSITSRHSHAS